ELEIGFLIHCWDQKIDKLKRDLVEVTTIRRKWFGVEKDDAASKTSNGVMVSLSCSKPNPGTS
ncbi:hypothetical protein HAX54_028744, partial [Datura stramonium]|nr:hypothetical protein [Datura stramonium]